LVKKDRSIKDGLAEICYFADKEQAFEAVFDKAWDKEEKDWCIMTLSEYSKWEKVKEFIEKREKDGDKASTIEEDKNYYNKFLKERESENVFVDEQYVMDEES
jgi:hypothetical protein